MKDRVEYTRVSDTPDLILSDARYADYTFEPHYHLDYHIGLVVDGVQRQRFQGESVLLGPGRISVMPPGEVHDGIGYDSNAYVMKTFRISPTLLTQYFDDIFEIHHEPHFAGAMIESHQLSNRLLELHHKIQSLHSLSPPSVEELWIKLLEPLLSGLCVIKPKAIMGGLSRTHWKTVKDYCYANLARKITLEELAGLCDLSRYQFLRRFEKTIGVTPKAWLIRLRLEHACSMLRASNQSIADVATEVGFCDQSHFNRAFRQAYGVAPSQY